MLALPLVTLGIALFVDRERNRSLGETRFGGADLPRVHLGVGVLGTPVALFRDRHRPATVTAWLHPSEWFALSTGDRFSLVWDVGEPEIYEKISPVQAIRSP